MHVTPNRTNLFQGHVENKALSLWDVGVEEFQPIKPLTLREVIIKLSGNKIFLFHLIKY